MRDEASFFKQTHAFKLRLPMMYPNILLKLRAVWEEEAMTFDYIMFWISCFGKHVACATSVSSYQERCVPQQIPIMTLQSTHLNFSNMVQQEIFSGSNFRRRATCKEFVI